MFFFLKYLTDDLIFCPISDSNNSRKFILEINQSKDGSPIFKISSPLTNNDKERRYGIFQYDPGKSEYIDGGKKSWAEN